MTGPVIQGRAGRTPLPLCSPANYPVSGLPLSAVSFTFALLHAAPPQLHLCTASHLPLSGPQALVSSSEGFAFAYFLK
jgi:hypothetical protein